MTGHGAAAAVSSTSITFILSSIIFVVTFALILTEKVHRTVIGMFGAVLMVTAGIFLPWCPHRQVGSQLCTSASFTHKFTPMPGVHK